MQCSNHLQTGDPNNQQTFFAGMLSKMQSVSSLGRPPVGVGDILLYGVYGSRLLRLPVTALIHPAMQTPTHAAAHAAPDLQDPSAILFAGGPRIFQQTAVPCNTRNSMVAY